MSDAYSAAGVNTDSADVGLGALVAQLRAIETGLPSRVLDLPGHYASVLAISDELGIAIGTDGVGTKLVVAEQAGRLNTIGIDCVAMNVNDIVCVGAEPIALVDYLAVESVDPARLGEIGVGLRAGAELAGCEIPGGELAVIPELIRGHPSPGGFDLCATAIGTVRLDRVVTGEQITPGDVLIGLPSSGIHSNGYTLARHVLLEPSADGSDALSLDDRPGRLGGLSVADALLEPTVIYVRAIVELLHAGLPLRALAHITGGGLTNLLRIGGGRVGYRIDEPLTPSPIFGLIAARGRIAAAEMWEVFNMGCGFVVVVPETSGHGVADILARRHPGARIIGTVTDRAGSVELPSLGITLPTRK